MLKSVKNDVLERLRRKRLSADPQLESLPANHVSAFPGEEAASPNNMMTFLNARKGREEAEKAI